jgi:hypothetical protein
MGVRRRRLDARSFSNSYRAPEERNALQRQARDLVSLGFVVSHPFAKKKAKGWGTEMVQEQAVTDLG